MPCPCSARTHPWLFILLLVHACLLLPLTGLQAADVRVTAGKCELASGTCELKIEASGLSQTDVQNATSPTLKEVAAVEPRLSFEFEPAKSVGGSSGARTWFFLVKATGSLSVPSQERKISITWGPLQEAPLSFTLATAGAKDSGGTTTIKWTLEQPVTPWNLAQDRWTEFTVTSTDKSLTSIVLRHSTYQDARPGRGSRLPLDQFYLCKERTTDLTKCSKSADLAIGTSTFWLTVDPRFEDAGTFTGTLEVGAEPNSDLKNLSPAINQTGSHSQPFGLLWILVGVTTAWLLLAFGRGRFSRDQALLPAAVLRERASELVLQLGKLPDVLKGLVPNTNSALAGILGKLAESYLDAQQFLPPRIPSSFGGASTQAAAYQTFLQNESGLVDDLSAIVTQGIVPASQKWTATISDADLNLLRALITKLDALSNAIPQPLATLQPAIATLLANWHPTAVAQAAGGAASPFAIQSPAPRSLSSLQILVQMQAITIVFWIVWTILTTLAGFIVLIAPSPGFGGWLDYVQCLLWGFGLPVAGQSLQQLSVSSINTQLGITLPKP